MRCQIITRDISKFPMRDLQIHNFRTDLEVWWGDKAVPKASVAVFDLGDRDFLKDGPIDLTGVDHMPKPVADAIRAAEADDLPPLPLAPDPTSSRPPLTAARKKSRSRKKHRGKRAVGRPRKSPAAASHA